MALRANRPTFPSLKGVVLSVELPETKFSNPLWSTKETNKQMRYFKELLDKIIEP